MNRYILKIDLDIKPKDEWMQLWIDTRKLMLENMGFKVDKIIVRESKRGLHIYIHIKTDRKISDEEINMLQFLMGDDHTRVKINQWRIERGIKRWNKLFTKVLYRRKTKYIECWYCGNKIPLINIGDEDEVIS